MMNCAHQQAFHWKKVYGVFLEDGSVGDLEMCDQCGASHPGDANSPDVYFSRIGQTFESLCDNQGRPYEIQSKRHKKQVMDQLDVREAPERMDTTTWVDGTRDFRRRNFEQERPKIQAAYKRWKETGYSAFKEKK